MTTCANTSQDLPKLREQDFRPPRMRTERIGALQLEIAGSTLRRI